MYSIFHAVFFILNWNFVVFLNYDINWDKIGSLLKVIHRYRLSTKLVNKSVGKAERPDFLPTLIKSIDIFTKR
ncbi:hypothetical protein BEI67_17385 [Photobacterium damselae subsp. piscicida]|nr:hypothetical protein [Photobacterium damselae]OLQ79262.1 hypothetical protein BEI67_17385 [Photobacterium damselae subsp. piscicida]PSV71566.1 hypothetical protein CTT35_10415 [Photobacterium damselae]PSW77337.1 hypothetical protein CTT37_11085 [Photobacterium damselae]